MYKILNESEHHYEIGTPEGGSFHVAKVGLSPKMHDNIKAMCEGGMAHYAEGTSPGGAMEADALKAAASYDPQAIPANPEQVLNPPSAPLPPMGGGATSDIKIGLQPPTGDISEPPKLVSDPHPEPLTVDKVKREQDEALALEKNAALTQAEATQAPAKAIAKTYEHLRGTLQSNAANSQSEVNQLKTREANVANDILQDVKPKTVGEIFGNKDLLGKIGTIASVILGIPGNRNGQNPGVAALHKEIQDDVDLQKSNKANKQTLYSKLLEQGKSDLEASLDAQSQQWAVAKASLGLAAAKNLNPQAQANYNTAIADISNRQAEIDGKRVLLNLQSKMAQSPSFPSSMTAIAKDPKLVVHNGDGTSTQTSSPEGHKKVSEANETFRPVISTLQNLLSSNVNPAAIGSPEYKRAEAQVNNLQLMLHKIYKVQRMTPETQKLFKSLTGNPTEVLNQLLHKDAKTLETLKTVQDMYDQAVAPYVQGYRTQQSFGAHVKR